jgi:hypothetical protein
MRLLGLRPAPLGLAIVGLEEGSGDAGVSRAGPWPGVRATRGEGELGLQRVETVRVVRSRDETGRV